jgi:hypothetical protein
MGEASRNHRKIASNIRELVVNPFGRWCDQHASRVQNSHDDLQSRIKAHDRQADTVRQYRSAYYNKCRRVEDLDEEEKLAFQDPNAAAVAPVGSPTSATTSVPSIKVEEEAEAEPIEIGDESYEPEQIKKIMTHLLSNIRLGEAKVPILGTYQNVTTGAEITEYIQKHLGGTSISYAERIGQDLITHGFLRLVGNMGNSFANSSKMNYQWRPKAFQLTGIPEKRPKLLGRNTTMTNGSDTGSIIDSPVIGDRVSEYLGGWNPLNNAHPNETPAEKLRREGREADERYKAAVKKLDGLRCTLEEAMIDHLKFMERCELDRLKAIKSVILDFSGAISNVIPSLQSTVDNMMLFQETVQPLGDLRYLLENYRTGSFFPKVTTYENYYNNVDELTFGVDIEARARSDRKRVPHIITSILTFLDSHYPDLEGDEARRSIWMVEVPLAATHHLRNQINTGKPIDPELLDKYEVPIVASVLKLYLLELPDSLVSSHVYEIIKTIYTTTSQSGSEEARVQVIQSTLGQLRLANIATLDALVTHFTRLIDLTSADDAYTTQLASVLAPCIMRPKQETGLSMNEKFNMRLLKDLFAHKDAIFGELKRQSTLTHTNSGATRQVRAVSTDESKRREHMEERQRAIAAATQVSQRHRGVSPSGSTRISGEGGHRRDRSRGPETRFPVAASVTSSPTTTRHMSRTTSISSSHRDSLLVPQSPPTLPPKNEFTADSPRTNGRFGSIHQPPPQDDEVPLRQRAGTEAAKRISVVPAMSASISSPSDFNAPGHYYSTSLDSPIGPPADRALDGSTPTKKDSLARRSAVPLKKTSGSMNRSSLVGTSSLPSRNDASETPASTASPVDQSSAKPPAGVQLEDKPMDFD